jgi:hypothetical protein
VRTRLRPLPWRGALLGAAAVALLGGPARADVVTLKGGKTLEGKVVEQDADHVVVETTFDGRREVPRAEVVKVDTTVPPLREQLAFRLAGAADVAALTDLAAWAKGKGFQKEVDDVWRKVVALDPRNAKAHKALGHVRVGDAWLTPEEKAEADRAAEEAAQRAKGLVPYEGRWVTPTEKEALEKGLVRDGDEWVTEAEFHRRRGERAVDGRWVRVGEAEGRARGQALSKAIGEEVQALWGPHVDLFHDLSAQEGAACLDAAEKAAGAFLRLMRPVPADRLDDLRIEVFCANKAPTYARYVERFAEEAQVARIAPQFESWASQASKARSFWWPHPVAACGQYLFPNTLAVLQSAVAHNVTQILLVRYRFNVRFSSQWLTEGLAYHVEMATLGRSLTFTIGRAGIGGGGDPAAWQDSAKWRDLLKAQALAGGDTPFPRLARARADGFSLPDLVKAWSVVDLLVAIDPAKFKAFVDATKEKGRDEEDALRAAYGLDFRQLEARWRQSIGGGAPP